MFEISRSLKICLVCIGLYMENPWSGNAGMKRLVTLALVTILVFCEKSHLMDK